ncbi:hypothetical protein HON22_00190 [Candidatus Peregrinibacteria bacterium]|jgi:DNA polymerase I|nr:hypothetical protein [Candidatus Peregrinibacteria bacterium]
MKKLVIIDGHNLIFRAFYGVAPLADKQGNPSNAIYGFASMLFGILALEKPDFLALTFDIGKSFRHETYPAYKGTRQKCPEELISQMPKIYNMVDIMKIPSFSVKGYEADDVIGTLAHKVVEKEDDILVHIISGDKDLFQLVKDRVVIAVPQRRGGAPIYYQHDEVVEKMGVTPDQVPDFKGLAGDSSDNIKGVEGIGPKGASKLLEEFQNLEGVYENLAHIKGSAQKKLETHKDSAFMSRELGTIVTDVPVNFSLDDLNYQGISEEILHFFQDLHFHTLIGRAQRFMKNAPSVSDTQEALQNKKPDPAEQMSLF